MSYSIANFIECNALQRDIDGVFGCNYTMTNKLSETSLLLFLMSPANTNGVLQKSLNPGGGKIKRVEVFYQPRISMGAVGTTINREDCSSSNVEGDLSHTYDIDETDGISWNFKIGQGDLIRRCEEDALYIAKQLSRGMQAMARRMDAILAADLIPFAGSFGINDTLTSTFNAGAKIVKTKESGMATSYNFVEEIDYTAEDAGYCNSPYIFGYNEIFKAMKRLDATCCASNGIDVATLANNSGIRFIPNRNILNALGATTNKFITLDAGQIQLIRYNAYQGSLLDANTQTYYERGIEHPEIPGLMFDLRVTNNCGTWSFFIDLAFQLKGLPNDIYASEDIYYGVTGVNKFQVVNP